MTTRVLCSIDSPVFFCHLQKACGKSSLESLFANFNDKYHPRACSHTHNNAFQRLRKGFFWTSNVAQKPNIFLVKIYPRNICSDSWKYSGNTSGGSICVYDLWDSFLLKVHEILQVSMSPWVLRNDRKFPQMFLAKNAAVEGWTSHQGTAQR